ncbi:MAG: DUF5127 domain-containing protein [Candidatus Hydrogenedentes bacterium]|nr:DUF5127 domain-containing protein [Candidatus Hydrogenedentota bacterium]
MKILLILGVVAVQLALSRVAWGADNRGARGTFRPPAIPLVTHDPYLSVWSVSDRLPDTWTRHWTGAVQAMCGMARIDGKAFRFAGEQPPAAPAMVQRSVEVLPTRTIYEFEAADVALRVTFLTPVLPDDLDVLARPLTYVILDAHASDGKPHSVQLYFDITGEWAVDKSDQEVAWGRADANGLTALRIGTVEQPVLKKKGDDLRIDWGHAYLAAPASTDTHTAIASDTASRGGFVDSGRTPDKDDSRMPRRANDAWPVLALSFDLGSIDKTAVSRRLMIAYDDEYSIELMGEKLRPYWRRSGMDAQALLAAANKDYPSLVDRCAKFDTELMDALIKAGGPAYGQIGALAYRHSFAAQKIAASKDGAPLMFPKENFSNGCISTVDVIYPAAPIFLLLNTALMKAQMKPVLDYAAAPRWKWPFAPHDLGTYPLANGQVYGGGEKTEENQMPVEESANLLILLAATAKADGNADFAAAYWPVISKWAEYLRDKGLDPEKQLCTDDFAGHLAHNTNLSIKAILALGAYSQLCDTMKKPEAAQYRESAKTMAAQWLEMAGDGDHYRLAFDKPGTWSQKYNLVWDKLLGLNLFPADVARKEVAYYKKVQNAYGVPLDNRKTYTKLDWLLWSATLAEKREDFDALLAPALKFINETPSRVPLTDWYDTVSAKMEGFQARPVIGGLFIKMLADESTWKHWSAKAQAAK